MRIATVCCLKCLVFIKNFKTDETHTHKKKVWLIHREKSKQPIETVPEDAQTRTQTGLTRQRL